MQNLIIGIAGMKGFGKSTYTRMLFSKNEPRLAVIDTLGEHAEWCPRCPEKGISQQVKWLAEPPERFQASFVINPFYEEDGKSLHFSNLCKAAYLAGEMTVVMEESDKWYPNAGTNWYYPAAGVLVDYGRHRLINLAWITRNLTVIDRKLTSQTDLFILFHQQEPLYLEKMEDRFTPEIVEQVATLPQFEYISVDRDKNWSRHKLSEGL